MECQDSIKIIMEELHMPMAIIKINNSKDYKKLTITQSNKYFDAHFSQEISSHPDSFIEIYKEFIYNSTCTFTRIIESYKINDKLYFRFSFVKMDNKFIGIHGTNITSEVQEKELLDKILTTRNELLGYLSHEIRTPLNGIAASVELINRHNLIPDELKKYTKILDSCSVTLLTIINDLLDLSRMEAKKMELSYKPFNLDTCIHNAISFVTAQNKLNFVTCIIDPLLPKEYIGDSVRIKQIVSNFVSNALKFTKAAEDPQVTVRLEYLGSEEISIDTYNAFHKTYESYIASLIGTIKLVTIKFSIKDSGIGIPENKLSMLFNPFVQLDTGLKKKHNGTGIGLSICKNLIDLMNGSIEVTSEEFHGSTFSFTIRLPEYSPINNSINVINYDYLIGKSILVIDDNGTNLKFIEQTLLKCKMLVLKASSAQEAIDDYLINRIPFSMILIDICMSGIDGCELEALLRNKYSYKCPIFGMSSIGIEYIPNNHKFTKILTKPISSLELISTLSLHAMIPTARRTSTPEITRNSKSILIVEDNFINMDVTISQLESLGYTIIDTAMSGPIALQKIKQKFYDIILMDISLGSELDGIETTEKIKIYYKSIQKSPKIIGVTANTMNSILDLARAAGMEPILLKPVSINQLSNAIKNE
jgi:signal transduction histidine kinase/CheY-like chemotaxis protein